MSRLGADLALLLVAVIWGTAFVAQKDGMAHVGPLAFVAARFLVSALLVLPLAWREGRRAREIVPAARRDIVFACLVFAAGCGLQQTGIAGTSVVNAGFLTGLYVLFVPLIGRVAFGTPLSAAVLAAAVLSVAGVALLTGGNFSDFGTGDFLVLLCAVAFAAHIVLVGRVLAAADAPFRLCLLQYTAAAVFAGCAAGFFEQNDLDGFRAAALPLLYAGAISGGIAYTLQVVAQKYAPPADAAVILSAEALFAALAGWLSGMEMPTMAGIFGCGLILVAVLTVELRALKRPL